MNASGLIGNITEHILNPIIILLFAIASLLFIIGIVRFLMNSSPESRQQGIRHMIWGVIGMFIMMSVFGIIHLIIGIINSIG